MDLVLLADGFRGEVATQTVRDRSVLVHLDGKVVQHLVRRPNLLEQRNIVKQLSLKFGNFLCQFYKYFEISLIAKNKKRLCDSGCLPNCCNEIPWVAIPWVFHVPIFKI